MTRLGTSVEFGDVQTTQYGVLSFMFFVVLIAAESQAKGVDSVDAWLILGA